MPGKPLHDPDLARDARAFLAVLDATETFLRVQASTHLPYASVVAVERAALAHARALLDELGVPAISAGDDATDELLRLAVSPSLVDLGTPPPAPRRAWADEEHTDTLPVAPEEPSWVTYDEEPEEVDPEDVEEVYEEPETQLEAEEPAGEASGLVRFEDPDDFEDESDTQVFGITRSAAPSAAPEPAPAPAPTPPAAPAPPAAREPAPMPIDFGDVGEDALVTIDEPLELEDVALEPEDLVDLELEEAGPADEPERPQPARGSDRSLPEVESFDLIPELEVEELELDAFEDDEETNVQAVTARRPPVAIDELPELDVLDPEVDARSPAPAARVRAVAPRGVAGVAVGGDRRVGLGASTPTIRDGDAPRPRAAAVQINATSGSARVVQLEEEAEPIEIGAVEDYDEDYDFDPDESGDGFRLDVQEYDDDFEEVEEDEEVVEPVAPPPAPKPPRRPSADEIRATFEKARAAAESGDMQRGAELFSDVIDSDPDNVDAHVGRGRLYLDLGDYTRAMSDFMVAEDIAADNPEPQIAIGDLYFARKDYRKAIEYFNAALEMSPNHAMAFCRRGISHYYRKNYRDSLHDLQRAQELDAEIPNIGTYIAMAKKKARK